MEKKIFEFFTALLEKVAGISYATGKEYLIESRLNKLALSLGYKDVKDIYQTIVKKGVDLKLFNEIIDALTTNETYFLEITILLRLLELIFCLNYSKKEKRKRKLIYGQQLVLQDRKLIV